MSATKDSSRPRPEGQPQSAIDAYARRVAGDLAQVVIPQAVQLLTMPTDSPAAAYRLRLGVLIASLRPTQYVIRNTFGLNRPSAFPGN